MEKNHSLTNMMQEAMAKVREMVDTNTIVGQPISTPDGVTLIPISRVSMGFGGGGGEFGSKKNPDSENLAGGIGAGVNVEPVSFLVVKDGTVRVLPVAMPPVSTVDRIVEMVPDVVDKVTGLIQKKTEEKAEPEAAVFAE